MLVSTISNLEHVRHSSCGIRRSVCRRPSVGRRPFSSSSSSVLRRRVRRCLVRGSSLCRPSCRFVSSLLSSCRLASCRSWSCRPSSSYRSWSCHHVSSVVVASSLWLVSSGIVINVVFVVVSSAVASFVLVVFGRRWG